MSKPKLVITEEDYGYQLAWFFPDDEDIGGCVGENMYSKDDLEAAEAAVKRYPEAAAMIDHREIVAVGVAVSLTKNVERRGDRGYFWERRADAALALKIANAAIKNLKNKVPWPDWAIKASAAGWKPPKNWKP